MGKPAAKFGDRVVGTDIHIVQIPTPAGPVPTPTPIPFSATLATACSTNVLIEGRGAATTGSGTMNAPVHIPPGGPFQIPPTNRGTVLAGSATVLINGKPAARAGDRVLTCADPVPLPNGTIISVSKVQIGG